MDAADHVNDRVRAISVGKRFASGQLDGSEAYGRGGLRHSGYVPRSEAVTTLHFWQRALVVAKEACVIARRGQRDAQLVSRRQLLKQAGATFPETVLVGSLPGACDHATPPACHQTDALDPIGGV